MSWRHDAPLPHITLGLTVVVPVRYCRRVEPGVKFFCDLTNADPFAAMRVGSPRLPCLCRLQAHWISPGCKQQRGGGGGCCALLLLC